MTAIYPYATLVCPRCGEQYINYTASLSRRDNLTDICRPCGTAEALEDANLIDPYEGEPYWTLTKEEQ